MIGREFRLPQKEAREKMTQDELEKTLELYIEWFLMNEEGMSFSQWEKHFKKGLSFQKYIMKRFGEIRTSRQFEE